MTMGLDRLLHPPLDNLIRRGHYTGVREGNLYRLQGEFVRSQFITQTTYGSYGTRGWGTCKTDHCLLREIVTGLPEFSIEQQRVCRGCMLVKLARASFPSRNHRSKGILDLLHIDLCGPMSVASNIGSMY